MCQSRLAKSKHPSNWGHATETKDKHYPDGYNHLAQMQTLPLSRKTVHCIMPLHNVNNVSMISL